MSARSMMRMRAQVWRNTAPVTDRDGFNQKARSWEIVVPALPCYAWAGPSGGRHAVASGVMVLVVDMPGLVYPRSFDVRPGDRIASVTDRMGVEILGKMEVDSVFLRSTHREARLKAYADVEG